MTLSIALTLILFLSCARMLAFCFFVPNVSPSAVFASRYWTFEGAAEDGRDFNVFTVWVNTYGDFGEGNKVIFPEFLFRRARRYLG